MSVPLMIVRHMAVTQQSSQKYRTWSNQTHISAIRAVLPQNINTKMKCSQPKWMTGSLGLEVFLLLLEFKLSRLLLCSAPAACCYCLRSSSADMELFLNKSFGHQIKRIFIPSSVSLDSYSADSKRDTLFKLLLLASLFSILYLRKYRLIRSLLTYFRSAGKLVCSGLIHCTMG